jgi:uncharacterized linocin/CFP29 family protein
MADLLRRELAPLTEEAWKDVDEMAARVLKTLLTARTVVDFDGPHGWELGAVNLGRLQLARQPGPQEIPWGIRKVLPLIELRVPFTLSQLELDSISRGAKDADFGPLEDAARRIAWFEDSAIYKGFADGGIRGILEQSEHGPISLPSGGEQYPAAVAQGVETLRLAGIPGPYSLVLGKGPFFTLMQSGERGYLPHRIVHDLIGGEILLSSALEGGILLSTAGGNFELTVGQDLAVGYASHNRETVELFFTESFAFRVLEPAAAVELKV